MLALLTASPTTPGFYRRAHTYLDKEQILAYDPSAGSYNVLQMIRDRRFLRGLCVEVFA